MSDLNQNLKINPKEILTQAYQIENKKPKKKKVLFYILILMAVAVLAELLYLLFIINY
ncbi:MAG: hypothetical protein WCX71_03270 [Candidatus Buchananbacteria bacterium]|jgi:hypothetical protein